MDIISLLLKILIIVQNNALIALQEFPSTVLNVLLILKDLYLQTAIAIKDIMKIKIKFV
jgi:hypothetical protein